ncbi:unnamed protein product [Jaminaea pallidilutea]
MATQSDVVDVHPTLLHRAGSTARPDCKDPDSKSVVSDDVGGKVVHDTASIETELPQGRNLGVFSAALLIVNRVVGTGVFATTSTILSQSGSVGMSLLWWVIGAIIAGLGFAVYAEFATAIPRNGGEINYIQHAYRKPRYLVSAMYAAQALLLGQAAGNAFTAGKYFLQAGNGEYTQWSARAIGVGVLLAALIMHGTMLKWGLRFQNLIGSFKLVILLVITLSGFAALAGHRRIPDPRNFDDAFQGSRSDVFGIGSAAYNAIWSYVGFSNMFYALGEVKNPKRTILSAGPLALSLITILYVLTQVAYFAAVPREDILGSEQIIAKLYFENVFGPRSAKALSVFVALSAVANVFSVVFAQGRLNQALGRDDLIPFAKLFASNRPFNAPLTGISWHVIVTLIILLAPPAGDAYSFVLNLSSYPLNVVNSAVGLALVLTYLPERFRPQWARDWHPPFRAPLIVTLLFTLVSLFLVVVPWLPPRRASEAVYEDLWYAMAPAVSLAIFALGAAWWLLRWQILPSVGHYRLQPTQNTLSDGTVITEFVKVR